MGITIPYQEFLQIWALLADASAQALLRDLGRQLDMTTAAAELVVAAQEMDRLEKEALALSKKDQGLAKWTDDATFDQYEKAVSRYAALSARHGRAQFRLHVLNQYRLQEPEWIVRMKSETIGEWVYKIRYLNKGTAEEGMLGMIYRDGEPYFESADYMSPFDPLPLGHMNFLPVSLADLKRPNIVGGWMYADRRKWPWTMKQDQ